jgi:NADPH-dependent ferric siderophore reductase
MASHHLTVTATRQLTPRMRRIELSGPVLDDLRPTVAQDLAIALHDSSGNPVRRRYTIRQFDSAAGMLTLDAVLHGHGPGAAWATNVTVGDNVEFIGPRGQVDLPAVDSYLLISDESGMPALGAIVEALPATTHVQALVEVADTNEEMPLSAHRPTATIWVHRKDHAAGMADLLAQAIEELALPPGTKHAIVLGESRAVIVLRDQLVTRGFARSELYAKGYWNLDMRPVRPPAT